MDGTIEQLRADIESARNREAVESEAMDGSKDRRREVLCCATVALRSVEPPKPPSRCMWSNSAAVAQRRLSIKRPDKVVAALLLHHVGALLYHAAGLLLPCCSSIELLAALDGNMCDVLFTSSS